MSEGKKLNHGERERREGRERERGMDGGNSRRERECGRETRREEERSGESGRDEDFPPPASSRDGSNFHREETRREEREERGREGREIFLLLPLKRAYARMQERRKEDGEERGIAREGEERERTWERGRERGRRGEGGRAREGGRERGREGEWERERERAREVGREEGEGGREREREREREEGEERREREGCLSSVRSCAREREREGYPRRTFVFKGILDDGTAIAVKRIDGEEHDDEEFKAEVAALATVQHRNLVRLLGFCLVPRGPRFLVYEFIENGSLDNWIFNGDNRRVLPWAFRYSVAVDVARALSYLHHDCRTRFPRTSSRFRALDGRRRGSNFDDGERH